MLSAKYPPVKSIKRRMWRKMIKVSYYRKMLNIKNSFLKSRRPFTDTLAKKIVKV